LTREDILAELGKRCTYL